MGKENGRHRSRLWPEIEAGRLKWEDVEADTVHPNDRGHAYAARFITERLAAGPDSAG